MADLFDHLDRIDKRERPLSPIRSELDDDPQFLRSEQECPVSGCSGNLWDGPGFMVCERCSAIKNTYRWTHEPDDTQTNWQTFQNNRPKYRYSNIKRQVGGFSHEWLSADDAEKPSGEIVPEEFYKS